MRTAFGKALLTVSLVAGSFAACGKDPVEAHADPQLTIAAESVAVNRFATVSVMAAVINTQEPPQYVSRDPNVATVNSSGAVMGVGTGSTYVVASLASRPNVRDSVRVRAYSDSCGGARPDFGGMATAEDRRMFSYDASAPLNLQKSVESTINGVEVSKVSFSSPGGGLVHGMMWDPVTRPGARPGIVLMHGHPGTASSMTGLGQSYAQYGAVVIAIDAPFNHRGSGPAAMTLLPVDSAEQIQVIKDLQRTVDVLRSRPNVDADRIAYVGFSWGGATGALFAGIERRLKAVALVVGHPGQASHATGPGGFKNIASLPCARRVAWLRAMAPVEPLRYVGQVNVPLLLQNGMFDEYIPVYEAEELHVVAPQPKKVLWYSTGHGLNQQALFDRHDWLVEQISLSPR